MKVKSNLSKDFVNTLKNLQFFSALHHRYYPTFLASTTLMMFCMKMFYLVLSWHVLELTDSPFLLGVVTASRYIATLLLGGIAGVIADSVSRRKILIFFLAANMVLMLAMAALILTNLIQYWHIVVIVTLWGMGGLAFMGARFAIIPDLVGKNDVTNAMGFIMITMGISGSIGSMLGGVLIGLIGFGGCYILIGAAYGAAVLLMFMVRVEETLTPRKESIFKNLVEGMKYIRNNQAVLAIIVIEALYNLLILPTALGGLLAVFARNVLVVGAADLGILSGLSEIGGLFASIYIASLGGFKNKGWLYLGVAMTQGITLFLFSMSRSYLICLILMIGYGFTNSAYNALANSLVLLISSDNVRGRVTGVKSEAIGTLVFGNLYSGALADSMGSPFAIALGGGLYAISVVAIMALAPKVKRLE